MVSWEGSSTRVYSYLSLGTWCGVVGMVVVCVCGGGGWGGGLGAVLRSNVSIIFTSFIYWPKRSFEINSKLILMKTKSVVFFWWVGCGGWGVGGMN